MVICTARSQRQVQMLAGAVLFELKQRCKEVAPGIAPMVEGAVVRAAAAAAGVYKIVSRRGGARGAARCVLGATCMLTPPESPAPTPPTHPPTTHPPAHHGPRPLQDDSEWQLVDCGSVVAHVFQEGYREAYDLEGLWGRPGRVKRLAPRKTVHTLDTLQH